MYLIHQLVSLFFGSLEFPQLSQLFHRYLGLATRKKAMALPVSVVQWWTGFLCAIIHSSFLRLKCQSRLQP